jgi:hypothetical protein
VEGINNKLKVLKPCGFGFRNFITAAGSRVRYSVIALNAIAAAKMAAAIAFKGVPSPSAIRYNFETRALLCSHLPNVFC